jgi:hypothetical protein
MQVEYTPSLFSVLNDPLARLDPSEFAVPMATAPSERLTMNELKTLLAFDVKNGDPYNGPGELPRGQSNGRDG